MSTVGWVLLSVLGWVLLLVVLLRLVAGNHRRPGSGPWPEIPRPPAAPPHDPATCHRCEAMFVDPAESPP